MGRDDGFPSGSVGKESGCNKGYSVLIPGSARSPTGGHGNPLQYSCLEDPTGRGAWWVTVQRVTKNQTQLNIAHRDEVYQEGSLRQK